MRWIEDALACDDLPRHVVATVGNYDGVHRGQQAILERVVSRAREIGLSSAVVTFEPHPLAVLNPAKCPARLTTRDQKARLLASQGVDAVIEIRFTPEFSETSALDFVREFLGRRLAAREVYVGSRFAFGREREGDVQSLIALGAEAGVRAMGVPEVLEGQAPVSSSRVRTALRSGDVALARRLLGRPFDIVGTIVRGEGRGAALGWPTMNLATPNELVPSNGVYASRVRFVASGENREAVTNVGVRPTFGGSIEVPIVESHVLEFARDSYGESVEVGFLSRLRAEQAFSSARELSLQIERDVGAARTFFEQGRS